MGFYDGMGKTEQCSAYDLARVTKTPVILVINGKGAALSLAALIKVLKNSDLTRMYEAQYLIMSLL